MSPPAAPSGQPGAAVGASEHAALAQRTAVVVFLTFAFAYFISALLRAVTATLAPTLVQEFALQARDLGLLAGGYFLGFAATQLPLGQWLDRHGPRTVSLGFLVVAVLGCVVFSQASGFAGLLAGRVLCGAGVSACLMAPLTGYRRWLEPTAQLRANSWMLMTGSLGMVASTLPVQWALPLVDWRPLFWVLAALIALAMVGIALLVPAWHAAKPAQPAVAAPALPPGARTTGYAMVWRNAYFQRVAPLAFFVYGGMVAVQTLWAGPWMQQVAGYTALQAAAGLFWINVSMLCTFWLWGLCGPWLLRNGWEANRLMLWGVPLSLCALAGTVLAGPRAGAGAWAFFCVCSSFVSLSQPAVALAFPSGLAGRALSAFNLVIFAGVFVLQWGIGLAVDAFTALGWPTTTAFQAAMAVYLACNAAAYAWFVLQPRRHNARQTAHP